MVGFDDVAADGQAQARAPLPRGVGFGLGREKRLEDPPQVGRRDPDTRVGHADLGQPAGRRPAPGAAAPCPPGHRLAGVDQEVEQHLLDLCRVDPRVQSSRRLQFQPHPVPRQVFLDEQDDFLDQPRQVGRLAVLDVSRPRQTEHPRVIVAARCAASTIWVRARSR